jgi:uncharacterized membrane protein
MSKTELSGNSMFNLNFVDKTFIQALTFGIVALILGMLYMGLFNIFKPDISQECSKCNENYILEMIMFLIGFTLRYLVKNEMAQKYLCDYN